MPHNAYFSATYFMLGRVIPSERQSAEYSFRAIKDPINGVTVLLPADIKSRYRILATIVHLFNFRNRLVSHQKIRTVYITEGTKTLPSVGEIVSE